MNRSLSGLGSILVVFGVIAYAQTPNEHGSTQQSAIVEIHLSKRAYSAGEGIELFLTLRPVGEGIYIAHNWGASGGNIPGFSVSLWSVDGKPAQTCGSGSVADYVADTATPAQWLMTEFMYLPANNFIGWDTGISCPRTERGKYIVKASYALNNPHTLSVAKLPSTQGRVITNVVEAQSVEIEIQ
jgi:hypothetical protein